MTRTLLSSQNHFCNLLKPNSLTFLDNFSSLPIRTQLLRSIAHSIDELFLLNRWTGMASCFSFIGLTYTNKALSRWKELLVLEAVISLNGTAFLREWRCLQGDVIQRCVILICWKWSLFRRSLLQPFVCMCDQHLGELQNSRGPQCALGRIYSTCRSYVGM